MKYMGSKNRISKYILPLMIKERREDQWWVEPFVGGGNLIDKVSGNRIGSDNNPYVIRALKFIRDNETPPSNISYSEGQYQKALNGARNGDYLTGLDCYALIAFSFGAKWCGGWSRGRKSDGSQRDYVAEQHRASVKQKPLLQGVDLIHSSYIDLEIPNNSIIYCDPPYHGATGYKCDFDHNEFWQWCREKKEEGHRIFVSEYSAPDDFKCIWHQELGVSVAKSGPHKKAVEKLFSL